MTRLKKLAAAALAASFAAAIPAGAQTQQDPHHPSAAAAAPQNAPAVPGAMAPGGGHPMMGMMMPMMGGGMGMHGAMAPGGGYPMMGMMMPMMGGGMGMYSAMAPGGGYPMMGMMMPMMGGGMGMYGDSMAGTGMIDRIEGRIAFLRAELNVTDAQAKAWDGLAQAMRANAKRLGETRQRMMPAGQAPRAASLDQQLDLQEAWYAARLDGLRAIKTAVASLLPALSDLQRRTAEELLPPHLGMQMGGGMGMVPMGGAAMPMRGGIQ
ncbi:MAG: Spy/CpxP family protein refolding chaperone [Alphaproteobacteria bacterium]|nr:Spy/CpxP family protein refolding chaperone [Alphaproteobacteria bacterium]